MTMKTIYYAFIGCMSLMCATSCTTKQSITTKTTDIYGSGVVQFPVVVDLDVKETKVSGTVEWKGGGASITTLKEMAMTDAIVKANADILVEPKFDIHVKGRRKTVAVSGYPATYKNFRNAVPGDTLVMKVGKMSRVEALQPMPEASKGKRALKTVLITTGSALGAGLLMLLLFG